MARRSAIDQYHAKLAEARDLGQSAARDLRAMAKELLKQLSELSEAYQQITGEPMPELSGAGSAARTRRSGRSPAGKGGKSAGTKRGGKRGKRSPLKGSYAGKTIPEAVVAALGKSKSGLGPKEIAEKIGGNRNSISVAMNGMVRDGLIKRAERGIYVVA